MTQLVHAAMIKWYVLLTGGKPPPGFKQQFLEPWTWESVEFGALHNQFFERWSS